MGRANSFVACEEDTATLGRFPAHASGTWNFGFFCVLARLRCCHQVATIRDDLERWGCPLVVDVHDLSLQ